MPRGLIPLSENHALVNIMNISSLEASIRGRFMEMHASHDIFFVAFLTKGTACNGWTREGNDLKSLIMGIFLG